MHGLTCSSCKTDIHSVHTFIPDVASLVHVQGGMVAHRRHAMCLYIYVNMHTYICTGTLVITLGSSSMTIVQPHLEPHLDVLFGSKDDAAILTNASNITISVVD